MEKTRANTENISVNQREKNKRVKPDLNVETAKTSAVRYLSLKLCCENQVRMKLAKDGYSKTIINGVVEHLKSMGYINDKLYAQKFIYDRMKLKPKSKKMLKYELQKKGVSEDIIADALDEWKIDDTIIIRGLIKKKFGKYDLNDKNVLKKVFSFLQHRGFSIENIQEAYKDIYQY